MTTSPPSADSIVALLEQALSDFKRDVAPLADEQALRATQARYLGKQGSVAAAMKDIRHVAAGDRPRVGEVANRVKSAIEVETEKKLGELAQIARRRDLERIVDVTLPGRGRAPGHLHLLTQVRREMVAIFAELGFEVATGPQVETDFYNFEAMAFPADHPARDMQDTFYVAGGSLLRTHTSPVQARTMLARKPPIRVVAPGVVFRRDDDPTHSPMFTQIEGLWVDRGVTMADLKGTLLYFVTRFFGPGLDVRFRASFFPFTEPSAEVDMMCAFCRQSGAPCRVCKGSGWIEIGGSGMVDPRVFEICKVAPEMTGFAFGMGVERMAMLRHGIDDIKLYYDADPRFLEQF